MMENLFVSPDEEDIIQIEPAPWWRPDEYIVLKAEILVEDEEWVQNRIMRLKSATDEPVAQTRGQKARGSTAAPQPMELEALLGSTKRLMLERMIVHGKLFSRRGLPLLFETEEQRTRSVRKLNKPNSDYIYEQLNALNQPVGEEEKKPSLNGVEPGTSATHGTVHLR